MVTNEQHDLWPGPLTSTPDIKLCRQSATCFILVLYLANKSGSERDSPSTPTPPLKTDEANLLQAACSSLQQGHNARYGKYYAAISLISHEPTWGAVTCPAEQAGLEEKNRAGHRGKTLEKTSCFPAPQMPFISRFCKLGEGLQGKFVEDLSLLAKQSLALLLRWRWTT